LGKCLAKRKTVLFVQNRAIYLIVGWNQEVQILLIASVRQLQSNDPVGGAISRIDPEFLAAEYSVFSEVNR
jgi:hypothetical protein